VVKVHFQALHTSTSVFPLPSGLKTIHCKADFLPDGRQSEQDPTGNRLDGGWQLDKGLSTLDS
jgi:hypothetical protein